MILDIEQLIAALPTGVYVCEAPSGVIHLYNQRAAELWGSEPRRGDTDETFSASVRLCRPDGSILSYADTPMADVLCHGGRRDEDLVIARAEGARIAVRVTSEALYDTQGRIVGAVSAFQDTTERKHAEEDAARLSAIVASADDAIISKTLDGIIRSWNRGAERIFGYAEAEAVGRSITLIIPPDRLHEEEDILRRLKRGEAIEHFETERRTKTGESISISLTVSPVKDRNGRIVGASKVARDITERRLLEREREDLLAREKFGRTEAQAASQAKDEFLAMLAHELRNPVGAIVSALAVLDDTGSHQHRDRAHGVIRRQAAHLARLIDDLLDVARITRGRIGLEEEPVDLRAVIAQVVETERGRIKGKRQHVTVSRGNEPVIVTGDPVRLQQIVANLLNNAVKYTPAGGSIGVTLGVEGAEAILNIRDDGAGIPSDRLESIFELFAQANPTLARTEGGLGIGLTLVKRLVELHGGSVHARSEGAGRGAEFVVRLPLESEARPPSRSPSVPAATATRRVLVIEDNNDGREMLVTMLQVHGHEVLEAATGAAGIAMALQHCPAVVLVDIGLPDIDGYEVGRQLRQTLGSKVRLVALTGYGQPRDRARSEQAGFDAHVVKPVEPQKLAEVL